MAPSNDHGPAPSSRATWTDERVIEQLFTHFDRLMQSPASVQRLRRFILNLAVRGKLVPQSPNDEPASELLQRIAKAKARLVKAGEIRKNRTKPVRMTETPFALPQSWKWASIGDIFLYDAGTKREPAKLNKSKWLLELEDVEKNTGRLLARIHVSGRASKSTKSEFRVGDILYGKLRPYLNKVLVADKPGYSTTEIVSLRPYLPICSQYCALALRRPDFVAYVTRLGQGTKMPRLRTEDAIIAPFPLPPRPEQHRIVAKVDELMALCDRLEAAQAERETTRTRLTAASLVRLNTPDPDQATFQKHVAFTLENIAPLTTRPEQIKTLRQTILNLAVQGKLVPQNPNDEPASELLKRIAKERKKHNANGNPKRPLPLVSENEQNFPLPTKWVWATVEALMYVEMGQSPPSEYYNKIGKGLPFYQGKADFGPKHPSPRYWCTRPTKLALPEDILISIRAPVGPTNIADENCCIGRGLAALRPYIGVDTDFILTSLKAFESRIEAMGFGSTFVAINKTQLLYFLLPLPPLPEQRRIVAKVNALMEVCDRLEGSTEVKDEARGQLFGALLHNALERPRH